MWQAQAQQSGDKLPNEACLGCHGAEGFTIPGPDGKPRSLHVIKDRFEGSVHGKRLCVECHSNITQVPHEKVEVKVSCIQCHDDLWTKARREGKTQEFSKLATVVEQIDRYTRSIHARPNKQDQSRTNAACYNCHDAHYVYPLGSSVRADWRLNIPNICGNCHTKERELYATSVHGKEVLEKHNPGAAICSDCHTTHDIEDPAKDTTKLAITKNCGNCHFDSFKSYTETYHGQVNRLGFAYTAKCFDCHGSHAIKRVADPASTVHPDNRLNTCRKCHENATAGFVTFQPHATTNDFHRYPITWIASKFMIGLLAGTFAFFWTHTALWFYREHQDRKTRKPRPHVVAGAVPHGEEKFFERFPAVWRLAHLCFALSLMILTLTGMTVFYADSAWAPIVAKLLGGPQTAAIIHRTAAVVFVTIFIAQLIYFVILVGRNITTFDFFGPNSLVPGPRDLFDIIAMFKWFFGLAPRPTFDRWTYWEKFDYWAPFWGVTIIGASGVMLWAKTWTAAFLPGWVFNVATIFHGEEAFLAAVFLFTVHFFNNHFRPDKFPLDIVMFTGAVPLEEFKREHALEYERLKKSGELKKYLVDAPSRPMTIASKILGFTLIAIGLLLLILVLTGFWNSVTSQ
jgi:cytochrome b subunit of formate dehydrogenase